MGLRKTIVKIALMLIAAALVLFFILPEYSLADWGEDVADNFTAALVGSGSEDQVEYCKNIMLGTNSKFQEAMLGKNGLGNSVSTALKVVGGGFALIYLMSELFNESKRGALDGSTCLRIITKVVIVLTVIIFCDAIFDGIQKFGNWIVEWISSKLPDATAENLRPDMSQSSNDGNILSQIWQGIKGVWNSFTQASELMIPTLLLKMDNVVVKTISYTLFLEMAIRRAFAPIAIADILSEGIRSPGVRYFKKFFGIYMKMAIVLFVIAASWQLIFTTIVSDRGGILGMSVVYDATSLLAAGKVIMNNASTYVDEILDT